jgi:cytochrome d ubiquinol oxidase subunit II
MMLDYMILRIIWWLLLGILLMGFAIMDGFDLGIGMLLPFVARTNVEKRVVINTIGPVWEGNQVWIILGAGAIFAAWPQVYAVSFSGFYLAMFLALIGFILRPVGFKYRGKVDGAYWRLCWDSALFLGGLLPTFVFGVALGNILQGVPFYFDTDLRQFYTGSFFQLLNPFALLCGFISIAMLIMHGGLYLAIKTESLLSKRALNYAKASAVILIILFAIAGFWIAYGINGYVLTSSVSPSGPSNPLYKTVAVQSGAWLNNYYKYPWTLLAPLLGFTGAFGVLLWSILNNKKLAFVFSGLAIIGIIGTVGLSMFPFILPSSINPTSSLLVWDASSSQLTLFIMLIATAIFLPIILLYTKWVYGVLSGKVTTNYVEENKSGLY